MKNTKNSSLAKLFPVMLCFFAMGFVDLVGIASNYVKADLNLTDSQANIFPSLVFFWFLIFSVPTGMLMNRIGRKKTVLLSLVITFASLLLPVFGDGYVLMLLSFSLLGIGNALMQTSLNPLLSNIVSGERLASSLTFGQFVKAIASFLAPYIAMWGATQAIPSLGMGWRVLFPVYMVIAVIAILWLSGTSIREEKELTQSRRIATIWVVISMFIAVCIGVIGYSVSAAGKVPFLATSAESETIIIKLADLMSQHGVLLAIMAGIILSGILAATMSTADSQLLAAASSVSQDLMQHSFGMKMNQRTTMLAARATVICIAIIGMVLAWDPNSSVFRVVSFAWAGFGAAFGPVMLFSLFWKRANKQGALAGMITGGAVVFIWKYLIAPMGGAWAIYELLPAFLAACIAIVIVSLATPAPEKAVTDTFDEICGK